MKILITTLTAIALSASVSLAEDKPPGGGGPGGPGGEGKRQRPNPEEMFKRLDSNGDGSISADEFKASPRGQKNPERADEAFKRMDKDADGKVTTEEFKA